MTVKIERNGAKKKNIGSKTIIFNKDLQSKYEMMWLLFLFIVILISY